MPLRATWVREGGLTKHSHAALDPSLPPDASHPSTRGSTLSGAEPGMGEGVQVAQWGLTEDKNIESALKCPLPSLPAPAP